MKIINTVPAVAIAFMGACNIAGAVEFNVSTWAPESHPVAKYFYTPWVKDLEQASGGSLKPNLYTGPVLLPPAGHLSGLSDGIIQVGYHAGTYTPSDLPEDNLIAQLAFNLSDPLVAAFSTTEANFTMPELQAMGQRHNVVYLSGFSIPPYNLLCTTELKTLDDLKGKKIRVSSAAISAWVESVGAVAVNVSATEMYGGLDKGQLDCTSVAANELKSRSIWDVAKHAHMVSLGVYASGYMHAANRDFWVGLTPQERDAFWETLPVVTVDGVFGYIYSIEEALTESAAHDVTVHDGIEGAAASIDAFKTQVRDDAIDFGKSKLGLANSAEIVSRFEAIVSKWEGLLADVDRTDRDALIELLKVEFYDKIDRSTYGL